jgi:hypothetical protein
MTKARDTVCVISVDSPSLHNNYKTQIQHTLTHSPKTSSCTPSMAQPRPRPCSSTSAPWPPRTAASAAAPTPCCCRRTPPFTAPCPTEPPSSLTWRATPCWIREWTVRACVSACVCKCVRACVRAFWFWVWACVVILVWLCSVLALGLWGNRSLLFCFGTWFSYHHPTNRHAPPLPHSVGPGLPSLCDDVRVQSF